MRIANRLQRAERKARANSQAALKVWLNAWLEEMPREDLLTMQAFVEAMFAGKEEEALAMLPAEDLAWVPNLTKWMQWAARV